MKLAAPMFGSYRSGKTGGRQADDSDSGLQLSVGESLLTSSSRQLLWFQKPQGGRIALSKITGL